MSEISRRLVLTGAACMAATSAVAQPLPGKASETLVGTWTLVSIYRELEDGSHVNMMGDNPKGLMIFDAHERFSHQIVRADGARLDCMVIENVSEENRAAAIGVSSYFGTYEVSEAGDSIVLTIEASILAQQIGVKQRRFIKVSGDTFDYWTPRIASAKGSFVRRLVWRRV